MNRNENYDLPEPLIMNIIKKKKRQGPCPQGVHSCGKFFCFPAINRNLLRNVCIIKVWAGSEEGKRGNLM